MKRIFSICLVDFAFFYKYFVSLGKVHRRLENMHKALLNYSWATEMDPRGEQMMAHGVNDNYSDDSYTPEQEDVE